MRPYKIKILPGETFDQPAFGNYVRVKSSSVELIVQTDTGEIVELSAGDSANLAQFKNLKIIHLNAAEQAVVIFVGTGTRVDSSRVAGNVSIIENPLAGLVYRGSYSGVIGTPVKILDADTTRRMVFFRGTGSGSLTVGSSYMSVDGNASMFTISSGGFVREKELASQEWWAMNTSGIEQIFIFDSH